MLLALNFSKMIIIFIIIFISIIKKSSQLNTIKYNTVTIDPCASNPCQVYIFVYKNKFFFFNFHFCFSLFFQLHLLKNNVIVFLKRV
jgi:hypothetical protein